MKPRLLFVIIFFGLWVCLGFYLAKSESPTFDEPVHLKAGQEYQKGNYNFDPIEPPLFRRLVYSLGNTLEPSLDHSATLLPFRFIVVVFTGLFLSLLLWILLISSPLSSALVAGTLFLTEANLVAHSHYFTTDAAAAVVSTLAAFAILSSAPLLMISLLTALAASIKIAALGLLAPLFLIKFPKLGFVRLLVVASITIFFIWATYSFRWQPVLNQGGPTLPLGGYLRAVKDNILFANRGQPIFFLEQVSNSAPTIKTPLTLLLKTPLPLFILAFWSFVHHHGKKGLSRLGTTNRVIRYGLLIFLIAFFLQFLSPLNFGIRHLLSAEIALILIASQIRPKILFEWLIVSLLIFWQIFGFYRSLPQPITFTNELAGGQPYRIFTDSDYDWGQGLLQLNEEIKSRSLGTFQLAYFGNVDPAKYLPPFTRVKDASPLSRLPVKRLDYDKALIISLTCYYQCGYYLDPKLSPSRAKTIAKSFLIFND